MKHVLFLSCLFLYLTSAKAQDICGGAEVEDLSAQPAPEGTQSSDCGRSGPDYQNYYQHLENYIPNPFTPVKSIHINLVVWQNDAGTTNFQDNPTDRARLEGFIHDPLNGINFQFYERYIAPSDPVAGVTEAQHKKLRFELEHIYFIRNTDLAEKRIDFGIQNELQDELYRLHPEAENQVNVHISTGGSIGYWGFQSFAKGAPVVVTTDDPNQLGYSCQAYCPHVDTCIACPISIACDNGNCYRDYSFMSHIGHELGHVLTLLHPYGYNNNCSMEACNTSALDYMDDLFPYAPGEAWCVDPNDNNCKSGCNVCVQEAGGDPYANANDKYTNNLMSSNDNGYITPKQLGKAHRALALSKVRDFTSGYTPLQKSITQDETWDFSIQLYRPLVIRSGYTLTIKCELKMPPQGHILIEPGAKLVIDGGHVTKSNINAGNDWSGIYVSGHSNAAQTPTHQGVLEVINGGKISHARSAINNFAPGSGGEWYNWGTMGGIITAKDAAFENNKRDVQLVSYSDPTTLSPQPYKASFRNCSFTRNNAYSGNGMIASISMWDVGGVEIEGCTFTNDNTGSFMYEGQAIFTLDASYRVHEYEGNGCHFEGYADAIRSANASYYQAASPITIVGANFTNNIHAIYLMETQFSKVAYNTISVRANHTYTTDNPNFQPRAYGIYLDFSDLFQLHDNTLSNPDGTNYLAAGIVVKDNCGASDQVYKNTADNFYWGMQAIGQNRNSFDPDFGLNFLCNDLGGTQFNSTDILVNEGNPSIAQIQGDVNTFPNNRFGIGGGARNFDNFGPNVLYTYGSGDNRVEPVNSLGVTKSALSTNADYLNSCPSLTKPPRISDPGATGLEIEQVEDLLAQGRLVREQLIDGGSTPQLEAQILFAVGQTAYQQLYLDLMDMAPHVSVSSLYQLTQLADFPELALRNVMVANPHGARDNQVWDALENRQPPLSQQTLSDIEDETRTITTKDVADMRIANGQVRSERLSLDLLEYLAGQISTGGSTPYQAIKTHLKARDEVGFRYALVDMLLAEGNIAAANTELTAIPNECALGEFETTQLGFMHSFYDVVKAVKASSEGRMDQLSTAQLNSLQGIVDAPNAVRAKGRALALLALNGEETAYMEPVGGQVQAKRESGASASNLRPAEPHSGFTLYPNPSNGHTILQWKWFEAGLNGSFTIYLRDMKGTLIKQWEVEDHQANTKLLRIKNITPGVYILSLETGDKVVYREKLSVQ